MEAEEVPEKIYLYETKINNIISYRGITLKGRDNDIEYIRKEAFMKKVFDAYCKVCGHYHHTVPTHICRQNCDYFSDFKKYMEDKL